MGGVTILVLGLLLTSPPGSPDVARAETADADRETVVLLHGLGRSPRSLKRLERRLAARGFRVVNVSYPSRRSSIEELSEHLHRELARHELAKDARLHFVTHSMGGIVVRHYLKGHRPGNLGRVVMLAPPNGGSELVDRVKRIPLLRRLARHARGQLGTDPSGWPARLGPVDFELGVIAGTRTWNPLFSWALPGRDDGMVSVERAKVDGMNDFLTVRRTHTFVMRGQDVITQTIEFLRNGEFERKE
jgi:pimeloyl-ACP methyl ester carboxylesterase